MDGRNALIETRNLTKRYGSRITAVDGLNLAVRRGEVYGFLGPNGAGKTTTLRMLLGLIEPTSGAARVLGQGPGSRGVLRVASPGLRRAGAARGTRVGGADPGRLYRGLYPARCVLLPAPGRDLKAT